MSEGGSGNRSTDSGASVAPIDVAKRWATALSTADFDTLIQLYAPAATVHAGADVVLGRGNIQSFWQGSPLVRSHGSVETVGHGEVSITWPADEAGDFGNVSRLKIHRGHINEQWVGELRRSSSALAAVPMEMSVSGRVGQSERREAWDMVEHVLGTIHEPVTQVRVRLERPANSRGVDRATLRTSFDLRGDAVRVHATETDVAAAVSVVERRLKSILRDRVERRRGQRHRVEGNGQWRHGDMRTERPDYFPRPADEREVVRHKTFAPAASTFDEAAFDLDMMDYDFYLYVDADSGADSVIVHGEDGVDSITSVGVMALAEARERLDAGDDPLVFFTDSTSDRGHVLYRRYDGHYGLIVPHDED